MKEFEVLSEIPTNKFAINGIIYKKEDVYKGRFTKVVGDANVKGKIHVRWNKPQKAFVDEYFNSVKPQNNFKAREAICSGFLFEETDIEYLLD